MYVRKDCRNFKGDRPCLYNTASFACLDYQPQGKKILIIKLAAVGDVLRTTPILHGLKRKYPHSFITWITLKDAADLLETNHYIDRLLVYDSLVVEQLKAEKFDQLICLDKETEAVVLANRISARKKFGFGLNPKTGNVIPLNRESGYAWKLGLSDELKFRKNKKSYPQIIFEMTRLKYRGDRYILNIPVIDREYAENLLNKMGISGGSPVIGLNTGAGGRFANKAWTETGFIELIRRIHDQLDTNILLLGGPNESELNARIASKAGGIVYNAGCGYSLRQFAAIIDKCCLIVCGDTMALHIALALKKIVVAIFGPTCEQEITLYGRGIKLVSPISCRPCYKLECKKENNCMALVRTEDVFTAVQNSFRKCKP
ncbi:MAG: glycosyltransferase family 9 protein [Candidatus Omnitrophota bacterium]